MSEKKGLFGLFGKKEEEAAEQKAQARKQDLDKKSAAPDIDKAKADMLMKQKEMMEEAKKVTKYTVKSGDTLSAIAQKYYDDAGAYMKIYEANKDVIGADPNLIQPGMELVIPKK